MKRKRKILKFFGWRGGMRDCKRVERSQARSKNRNKKIRKKINFEMW